MLYRLPRSEGVRTEERTSSVKFTNFLAAPAGPEGRQDKCTLTGKRTRKAVDRGGKLDGVGGLEVGSSLVL